MEGIRVIDRWAITLWRGVINVPIPFDQLLKVRIHILDRPVRRTFCGVDLVLGSLTCTVDFEDVCQNLDEFIDTARDHVRDELKAELDEPLVKPFICEACLAEASGLPLYKSRLTWLYAWFHVAKDEVFDGRQPEQNIEL